MKSEEQDRGWLVSVIICPHCYNLSVNIYPIEAPALELPCSHWVPLLGYGFNVDSYKYNSGKE